jgi:PST family polysaccharide transporter/lipopolysaccharide exporter
VFIAALLFAIAPLLSSFFGEPNATGPLRGIALTPLLLGLRNPAIVYFQKDLDFHKEFVYRLTGSVALPIVAIGYALVEQSVWALIFGFVAADLTRLATSYVIDDYRPGLDFDRWYASELIDYGKWITGSSILNFLHNEGDDIVVGWLLSASALAFYQLSYRFANAPATEVGQTISKVAFPTFSKLQDDPELLRESFYRIVRVTAIVSFPIAFGIAAVAPTFIEVFLGTKWLPMVATMQLLAMYGLLRTLGKTWSPVWKTVGRPDYLAKLPLLRVGLMAVLIYPAVTRYGIEGSAGLVLGISLFPMFPINFHLIVDAVDTTYRRLLTELSYPLVSSVVMFLVTYTVQRRLELDLLVAEFVLLVLLGAVTYVVCVLVFERLFGWDVSESARQIMSSV